MYYILPRLVNKAEFSQCPLWAYLIVYQTFPTITTT
ncbi:uncharacterized protein METZ01_LOCUS364386 [marine metagenome]|uniref:Uncharacterized protein n=1 Tax=marine metagenome TaxID=408172 RepID=A0A382SPQ4_9ZZZZ